jgi:hypothetical protein
MRAKIYHKIKIGAEFFLGIFEVSIGPEAGYPTMYRQHWGTWNWLIYN